MRYALIALLVLAGCQSPQEKETRETLAAVAHYMPDPVVAPGITTGTGDATGQATLRDAFKAAERDGKLGRVDSRVRNFIDGRELRDGWGSPLYYQCDSTEFVLGSPGEDTKRDTGDDITVHGPARPR